MSIQNGHKTAGLRRAAGVCVLFLCLPLVTAVPIRGQQPAAGSPVTVVGTVIDASTRSPVAAAEIVLVEWARRATSDVEGRFRITSVPLGPQLIQVRRLGYQTLALTVSVTDSSSSLPGIEISLVPDPIQLQGLGVRANARANLTGTVVDARTEQPVQWAFLTLTRGATERVGRPTTADEKGAFRLPNVVNGEYMLKVERLGYFPQYLAFVHTVPPAPVEVRLEPDEELREGLVVFKEQLETRKMAFPRSSRSFAEERVLSSAYPELCDFLTLDAQLKPGSILIMDDKPGALDCRAYRTAEIAHVNVFECRNRPTTWVGPERPRPVTVYTPPPAARPLWTLIFVYTNQYMEQMARRPREAIPLIC